MIGQVTVQLEEITKTWWLKCCLSNLDSYITYTKIFDHLRRGALIGRMLKAFYDTSRPMPMYGHHIWYPPRFSETLTKLSCVTECFISSLCLSITLPGLPMPGFAFDLPLPKKI